MWIIIFLANPIEQNLQEPAPLSNGAEISWDNEIVVVVFLNIDWIWGSLWEAKPMLLSQSYCFGVPSAWCRWCTVHTQSALPTLPYITCSYCAVQSLLSLDPVRLCFWARAPDVLAVGLQHMVCRCSWQYHGWAAAHRTLSWHPSSPPSLHLCVVLPNKLPLLCSALSLQRRQEHDRQEGWRGKIMSSCVLLRTILIIMDTSNTRNEGKS